MLVLADAPSSEDTINVNPPHSIYDFFIPQESPADTLNEDDTCQNGYHLMCTDSNWWEISFESYEIPVNINGNQGSIVTRFYIEPNNVGDFVAIFDHFTEGLTSVNAAIFVNERLAGMAMNLKGREGLPFTIYAHEVGLELRVVMSTDSLIPGLVQINLITVAPLNSREMPPVIVYNNIDS